MRALRTKVSDARACVEKRSHLVVVALFVIVRVINRVVGGIDRTRLSFCRIRNRRAGSFASSAYDPRLDSTRVSARSRDPCVTILHFRAVIDGVEREPTYSRSRCVVREVILSMHSSFTHPLIHSFITHHVARLVDRARDSFPRTRDSPLASRHLDERVDSGARDSSRRAAKTNRHEKMRGARGER